MACPLYATLHNGGKMPLLGYGTWQGAGDSLEKAVEEAIRAGYRHIDTAAAYQNEDIIGRVITDGWINTGKLKREDLFIVTKLPPSGMKAEHVEKWLKKSLAALKMDYVDLYLVHLPIGVQEVGDEFFPRGPDGKVLFDYTTDHLAIWKAMEEQVRAGRAKAIGVSNFNERQIQRVLDNCTIKLANLQVELHLYFQQKPLVEFCKKNGITVCAYSSLGSPGSVNTLGKFISLPNIMENPTVVEIANKHNKTPAQIILRHIVQNGVITIPKSTTPKRIADNIQLFDFELLPEEMNKLNALDQGKDGRIFDWTKVIPGIEEHPEFPL